MKLRALLPLIMLVLPGQASMLEATATPNSPASAPPRAARVANSGVSENNFDLSAFGAVGDGVADDGPALQSALDAIAAAGGGTLFVPAGRYAIITPVQKDFSGLATSVTIQGVESSTPVPPPTSPGDVLTRGLDLVSEFAPRTGQLHCAVAIAGLENFLIKDIVFIGTPGVSNDALISLALNDILEATIRHCEFYGLSSLVEGGAIVQAVRSNLTFEQSVVLGSTCSSGVRSSVIQNLEWKGVAISDAIFADYGQRAELSGKLTTSPYSWVGIGNAAAQDNDSPRREAVFRNVFLDEGGYFGLTSVPHFYSPPSAPIDLIYITGLHMNVSNFGTAGHYLDGPEHVLIEKSHYGWSHNADSAIQLLSVGRAIIDEAVCLESANRIRADSQTGKLTVINSVYTYLDSEAETTDVITTATPEDDPVQYVRQQFDAILARDPDPAAHFYWSDQLLQCGADSQCVVATGEALATYLGGAPATTFGITGHVIDGSGAGLPGVAVTLSGSQSVTTSTNSAGQYHFSNLPTSGVYTVTPTLKHHTLAPVSRTIATPAGDQVFDSAATLNHHVIDGQVADAAGTAMSGVTVTLSGAQNAIVTTGADGNYSFGNLPAGGNYTVTPQKTSYTFSPANQTFPDLGAEQNLNFTGTFVTYSVSGIVVNPNNYPMSGVTVALAGAQNGTTTSDSSGNFSFTGLPSEGGYTITPSLIGHSFNPSSRTYNNLAENQYHSYVATYATHSISGRVTDAASGAALSGAVVTLSGHMSASTTTDASGNYAYADLPRGGIYTVTVAKAHYTFTQPSQTFTDLTSNQTADFSATVQSVIEFSAASYSVAEGTGTITLTVARAGDTSAEATVIYSATNGTAHQGDDLSSVIGQITYDPGETSQTFTVFITDDAFVESIEQLIVTLSDPDGATLGSRASATITINDNDSGAANPNPVDDAQFFVRQHYRDFLNREPDAAGLAFWSNQIVTCGTNAACVEDRRISVSAAFFLSIEFQETGFLIHRLYKASLAEPPQHLDEFLLDARTIAQGVVVNAPGWQQLLEDNKTAFVNEFVERPDFTNQYPLSLTPTEFVDLLNATAGDPLAADGSAAAVAEFNGSTTSSETAARARVLRRTAESPTFSQRELSPAFVLMQYFGYLQRNPSDAPDSNLDGYNFWLAKLNEFGGDFRHAQMVKSFLVAGEYRSRFGL